MTTSEVEARREALAALRRAGEVVQPRLRASLDAFCPVFRTVAGYHLGWYDVAGRPVSAGGGKSIRPALALLAGEAAGTARGAAVDAAVAVELVHNFSMVHDDVMDGDELRRHRPTVWSAFGVSTAIMVGDAMLVAAQQALVATGHPAVPRALSVLLGTVQHMLHGQAMDIGFESRQDVTADECVAMVEGKTAALMECACVLGALFGGADQARVAALGSFGRHLGMAFQYVDDLLGIWGDPRRTGKPVGSDLRTRKKSLPVVAALSSGTAAGQRLARLYSAPDPLSDDQLTAAVELVAEAGGRDWAQARAERHLENALSCLDAADVEPELRRTLSAIAGLVTACDE